MLGETEERLLRWVVREGPGKILRSVPHAVRRAGHEKTRFLQSAEASI